MCETPEELCAISENETNWSKYNLSYNLIKKNGQNLPGIKDPDFQQKEKTCELDKEYFKSSCATGY